MRRAPTAQTIPSPRFFRAPHGTNRSARDFVLGNGVTKDFMKAWERLLDVVVPGYVAEGKTQLSIAVGCTGGQHRSVAIANATADYLTGQGYRTVTSHRDLGLARR